VPKKRLGYLTVGAYVGGMAGTLLGGIVVPKVVGMLPPSVGGIVSKAAPVAMAMLGSAVGIVGGSKLAS